MHHLVFWFTDVGVEELGKTTWVVNHHQDQKQAVQQQVQPRQVGQR